MKKKYCLLFLLVIANNIFAQGINELSTGSQYFDDILVKYKKSFRKESDLIGFAETMVENRALVVNYSDIITDWPEGKAYLEKIYTNIIPKNQIDSFPKKIFFSRSSEINAFALEDGIIVVNAGLLAVVKSEAELIGVLGHEIGHYKLQHALRGYKALKSAKLKSDIASAIGIFAPIAGLAAQVLTVTNYLKKSRVDEAEADDFSLRFISSTPYTNKGFLNAMRLFIAMEDQEKLRKNSYGSVMTIFSTHPSSESRHKKIGNFLKENPETGKLQNVESVSVFEKIKTEASIIAIKSALNSYQFSSAIEMAFNCYLMQPDNVKISEALSEALCKTMLLYPETKNDVFISDLFNTKKKLWVEETPVLSFDGGEDFKKTDVGKSIHYHLFEGFLMMDSSDIPNIKARDILNLDTIEFVTNIQAYNYFVNKSRKLNSSKISFTQALTANTSLEKTEMVEEYFSLNGKKQNVEFCEALKTNTLCNIESNDTLVIYFDYSLLKNKQFLTPNIIAKGMEDFNKRSGILEKGVLAMGSADVLYSQLPFMSDEERNFYFDINQFVEMNLSTEVDRSEAVFNSKNVDLFKLKPELWEFCKKQKVAHVNLYYYVFDSGGFYIHDIRSFNVNSRIQKVMISRYTNSKTMSKYGSPASNYDSIEECVTKNMRDYFNLMSKLR